MLANASKYRNHPTQGALYHVSVQVGHNYTVTYIDFVSSRVSILRTSTILSPASFKNDAPATPKSFIVHCADSRKVVQLPYLVLIASLKDGEQDQHLQSVTSRTQSPHTHSSSSPYTSAGEFKT